MNSTVRKSENNSYKPNVSNTGQRINPELPLTMAERDAVARGVVRFNKQRQCRKGRLDNLLEALDTRHGTVYDPCNIEILMEIFNTVGLIKCAFPDKSIKWELPKHRPLPLAESPEVENALIKSALEKKFFQRVNCEKEKELYFNSLKL
jgi:hypothetical protein